MNENFFKFKKTALVSALLIELSSLSHAATITVDGALCNLNDAVTAANTDTATGGCVAGTTGMDVLELPSSGSLDLSVTATITSSITIKGNHSTIQPDPNNPAFRLINVYGGALTLLQTTLQNGSDAAVGGINVAYGSNLDLLESTVQNTIGGGVAISKQSSATLILSTIKGVTNPGYNNYGAGLTVSSSEVYVFDSTISNNSNSGGGAGGIWINNNQGLTQLTMYNSTISGNSNLTNGGGINHSDYGYSTLIVLNNITITGNSSGGNGGGIANDNAFISLSQSLVSGNVANVGVEINSYAGPVVADNYNVFGFNNYAGIVGVTLGTSDIIPSVPLLSDLLDPVLANNGGLTETHALNQNGPAVDAVPMGSCNLSGDQTGKIRPIDGDADGVAACDVGAFENENPDIIFEDGFD